MERREGVRLHETRGVADQMRQFKSINRHTGDNSAGTGLAHDAAKLNSDSNFGHLGHLLRVKLATVVAIM